MYKLFAQLTKLLSFKPFLRDLCSCYGQSTLSLTIGSSRMLSTIIGQANLKTCHQPNSWNTEQIKQKKHPRMQRHLRHRPLQLPMQLFRLGLYARLRETYALVEQISSTVQLSMVNQTLIEIITNRVLRAPLHGAITTSQEAIHFKFLELPSPVSVSLDDQLYAYSFSLKINSNDFENQKFTFNHTFSI